MPARHLLLGALAAGLAGDLLLRGGPPRLGATLVLLVLVAVAALLLRAGRREAAPASTVLHRERELLLAGLALAAFGFVLRDAETVLFVDVLSVLCTGALLVWLGRGGRLGALTVDEAARAAALAPVFAAFGGVRVVGEAVARAADDAAPAARGRSRTAALLAGIVLATPPVLLVLALLASADSIFSGMLDAVARAIGERAIEHLLVVLGLGWLAAGWLAGTLGRPSALTVPRAPAVRLPFLTVGVALVALIVVLALFLGTQARALFGGEAYLLATAGLTRAEYAREGFFQLVVASGVVLATLLASDWALAPDDAAGRARHRTAGQVLVGLVAGLLVSAAARMALYVEGFGLTQDRAFAMGVMAWVVLLLVTVALTTLRARGARFAPAMLGATVAWVIAMNLVNLDALVVRVNAARTAAGKGFDVTYHAGRLSADAVPALLRAAPRLDVRTCTALLDALAARWRRDRQDEAARGADWRAASVPRRRAYALAAGALPRCGGAG